MLCQFLLYNTEDQLPADTGPSLLDHSPIPHSPVLAIAEHREHSLSYPAAPESCDPCGSVCMPILISNFIPPSPSLCVHKFILHIYISTPALQAGSAVSSLTAIAEDFPGGSDGKASAYNAGDTGSIPGSGRSPEEGNGNSLQYSCLGNAMDREAWWARVYRITKESDMT